MPKTDETVAETTQQPATLGASVLGGMSVLGQLLRHHQPVPAPVGGLRSYGCSQDKSSVTPVCEGGLLQTKRSLTLRQKSVFLRPFFAPRFRHPTSRLTPPPPHVEPDARCHVVVQSAASSPPRGVHVSWWHTGTIRHLLSGIMGLLLLLYGVHCRASGRPSSTTPSLATMGLEEVA